MRENSLRQKSIDAYISCWLKRLYFTKTALFYGHRTDTGFTLPHHYLVGLLGESSEDSARLRRRSALWTETSSEPLRVCDHPSQQVVCLSFYVRCE
jgi:hypothetical protein